jgi:hypothetical protein
MSNKKLTLLAKQWLAKDNSAYIDIPSMSKKIFLVIDYVPNYENNVHHIEIHDSHVYAVFDNEEFAKTFILRTLAECVIKQSWVHTLCLYDVENPMRSRTFDNNNGRIFE